MESWFGTTLAALIVSAREQNGTKSILTKAAQITENVGARSMPGKDGALKMEGQTRAMLLLFNCMKAMVDSDFGRCGPFVDHWRRLEGTFF